MGRYHTYMTFHDQMDRQSAELCPSITITLSVIITHSLLYGGTLSHYFFLFVERVLHEDLKFRRFFQFALERLFFSPFYQGVSIYSLARFEGRDHDEAVKNLKRLYIPMIVANWKYLSLFTLLNFTVVPPVVNNYYGYSHSVLDGRN